MSHHSRLSNDASSCVDLKVFIKDVHDRQGRKRPLTVRPWATVKDVKDQLTRHLHIPASSQAIYFGPLLSSSKELPNHRTLHDAGIYRNGETLLLEIKGNGPLGVGLLHKGGVDCPSVLVQKNDVCVSSSTLDLCPKALQRLVQQSRRGLALGFKPALAPDGSGGSYFLSDARKQRVGVFKPADEEPFAENNPRGYVPHSSPSASGAGGDDAEWLRQGIRPGELCLREVAAFLLDHDGFSGVPMTTLAEARHPALHTAGAHWTLAEGGAGVGVHSLGDAAGTSASLVPPSSSQPPPKKVGSFQEFVRAECTMDDLSPSKVSADEVHKIAILDIRLMNADRNVANILCQRIPEDPDHFRLVPIDHGYALRSKCDVAWFDWCWLDWPQTKEPLSKASRDYVLGLDIEADARTLQERLGMRNDVLDYFRSSCRILKAGVRAGLTLYDIASEILCRNDPSGEIPSKLESLTTMASELAMSAVHNGRFHHATASNALEEQLVTRRSCLLEQPSFKPHPSSSKARPVVRSASSSVFSQFSQVQSLGGESAFTDELSKVDSAFSGDLFDSQSTTNNNSNPPGMVQSSQSDNSSFEGREQEEDDDAVSFASDSPEDCAAGEWAAALVAVADQSMDKESAAIILNRNRSISESSDTSSGSSGSHSTSLAKSPVGFWYVRPGSSSIEVDDNEPICWASSLQSSGHPQPDADLSMDDADDIGPPHILSPSGFSSSNLSKLLAETSPGATAFSSPASPALDEISHPSTNADDEFCPITPMATNREMVGSLSTIKPLKKTMNRSISFSAFSTAPKAVPIADPGRGRDLLSQSTAVRMRSGLSSTQANDMFRTYFVKFVDLLVVREMERLVHRRETPEA
ncbi:hypothetical protein ACHAWF_009004 [Thalassiosira exigua]